MSRFVIFNCLTPHPHASPFIYTTQRFRKYKPLENTLKSVKKYKSFELACFLWK